MVEMDHKKLKELQNIQYEMLKAVDFICKAPLLQMGGDYSLIYYV